VTIPASAHHVRQMACIVATQVGIGDIRDRPLVSTHDSSSSGLIDCRITTVLNAGVGRAIALVLKGNN
jgi:hypothetical protein